MDRSSKQKINKEIQVLNDTLGEMDVIDIFRTFHPNAEEYTFFSSAHGTYCRIDHNLGHKSNLSKFKKTEIISSIFSDHVMRLDINYKKKTARNTDTQRLNSMFLNNQQVADEIKKILETNDYENMTTQNLCDSAKAVLRDVYSSTILTQETRKTSNKQPNFTLKTIGKITKTPKISRRKEIIKI